MPISSFWLGGPGANQVYARGKKIAWFRHIIKGNKGWIALQVLTSSTSYCKYTQSEMRQRNCECIKGFILHHFFGGIASFFFWNNITWTGWSCKDQHIRHALQIAKLEFQMYRHNWAHKHCFTRSFMSSFFRAQLKGGEISKIKQKQRLCILMPYTSLFAICSLVREVAARWLAECKSTKNA